MTTLFDIATSFKEIWHQSSSKAGNTLLCQHCQDQLCPMLGFLAKRKIRMESLSHALSLEEREEGRHIIPVISRLTGPEVNRYVESGCPLAAYLKEHVIERTSLEGMALFVMLYWPESTDILLRGELGVVKFQVRMAGDKAWETLGDFACEVFANADDPAASSISGRPVHPDLCSSKNLDMAPQWVWNCLHGEHGMCFPVQLMPPPTTLPTRLLKVGCDVSGDLDAVQLHTCVSSGTYRYAALSYCWGQEQSFVTTKTNLEDVMKSIRLSALPRTIHDAVVVTRKIGLEYLWVDAFCIIQDSEQDKVKEVAKMGQIYQNAMVTITADRARSCHHGFLGQVEPRVQTEAQAISNPIPYHTVAGQLGSIMLRKLVPAPFNPQPIHTRGWTYQEAFLSRRLLSFGDQMSWKCPSGQNMMFAVESQYRFPESFYGIPDTRHTLKKTEYIDWIWLHLFEPAIQDLVSGMDSQIGRRIMTAMSRPFCSSDDDGYEINTENSSMNSSVAATEDKSLTNIPPSTLVSDDDDADQATAENSSGSSLVAATENKSLTKARLPEPASSSVSSHALTVILDLVKTASKLFLELLEPSKDSSAFPSNLLTRLDAFEAEIYTQCIRWLQEHREEAYATTAVEEGQQSKITSVTERKHWFRIVEEYSCRKFSYFRDRLPAISAVAAEFSQKLEGTYIAGLWEEEILEGLVWHHGRALSESESSFKPPTEPASTRPPSNNTDVYVAPSWSWASSEHEVTYNFSQPSNRSAHYVDCEIPLAAEENPFGEIKYGWIKLRAPMKKIHRTWFAASAAGELKKYIYPDRDRELSASLDLDFEGTTGEYFWLMELFHGELGGGTSTTFGHNRDVDAAGLVLTEIKPSLFKRVGLYSLMNENTSERIEIGDGSLEDIFGNLVGEIIVVIMSEIIKNMFSFSFSIATDHSGEPGGESFQIRTAKIV